MSQKCDCEGAGDDMDGITSAVRIPLCGVQKAVECCWELFFTEK